MNMENEVNPVQEKKKFGSVKPEVALRCAKAAVLLSTLHHHCPNSTDSSTLTATDDEDGEEIWELKKQLVKEKLKNKKMRMCSLAELFLQITIWLSLWTLCLFIAFDFL